MIQNFVKRIWKGGWNFCKDYVTWKVLKENYIHPSWDWTRKHIYISIALSILALALLATGAFVWVKLILSSLAFWMDRDDCHKKLLELTQFVEANITSIRDALASWAQNPSVESVQNTLKALDFKVNVYKAEHNQRSCLLFLLLELYTTFRRTWLKIVIKMILKKKICVIKRKMPILELVAKTITWESIQGILSFKKTRIVT